MKTRTSVTAAISAKSVQLEQVASSFRNHWFTKSESPVATPRRLVGGFTHLCSLCQGPEACTSPVFTNPSQPSATKALDDLNP